MLLRAKRIFTIAPNVSKGMPHSQREILPSIPNAQDAKKVVETWSSEFSRTKDVSKRLAMIYLANDILQNSRKKGAQFVVEFYHKLPAAIQQLVKQGDSKV